MRKTGLLTVFSIILILCVSCPLKVKDTEHESLTVVSWNLQNLFNAKADGNEYDEFLPSGGWTEESYKRRLSALASVLQYSPLSQADVIVLNEVENGSVVEDIINSSSLKKRGFLYYTSAGEPGGAIQIAVLSRIPIVDVKVHNIEAVRPIIQVELQSTEERIFILALHAKSNKEGVSETASLRLEQAVMVRKISNEILICNPDSLVLAAGDFNESYVNRNMMCDARISKSCPLCLLPTFQEGCWYCPWLDGQNDFTVPGSYFYNNEWLCYDNILISSAGSDKKGFEFDCAGVVFQGLLQTTDNRPNSYRRELLTGVSDHLPVWVRFNTL